MARTYVQPGDTLTLVAPTGGVTAGTPILIGALLVIPITSALATVAFDADVVGVHSLTKVGSQAWAEGQRIYWDTANSRCSSDPVAGPCIGVAAGVVGSGAGETTGSVRLNGTSQSGEVFHTRQRFTVAQVNAGVTVLPALAGRKYRMIDAAAIAIGGAAGAVTTVDILGTITTARKLVAFAQASLTQSTVLKAGGTGAAVLADGASYTANDANTAITVGITGSSVTTATHVDVSFTYAIDPA